MERARRGILMDENDAPCPPSPTSKPSRHVPSSPMKPLGSYRRPTTDKSRERSPAVGLQHVRRESGGRKRAVYCDVVLGRGFDPSAVLDVLGTSLAPTTSGHQTRPHMSSTPSKAPNVDQAKVRSTLVELYMTEDSYCRKITSLQRDYAQPLQSYAKRPSTAIITQFEVQHLFRNVAALVPLSEAFKHELNGIVTELQVNTETIPGNCGQIVLEHVLKMGPYREFLASAKAARTLYRNLTQSNPSFSDYLEKTQMSAREKAKDTGGFIDFLAEPFQRAPRYQLLIAEILRHLPATDGNVEALQQASVLLSDICSMRVNEATQNAASMWTLGETIESLPIAMHNVNRHFIDCIDVEEILPNSSSGLRCTLFLFNDKLLIAKRPTGAKGGRQHAGLDDIDTLVELHATVDLTTSQNTSLGSPKKLKKGVMGYRGHVDLNDVYGVDLEAVEFGLVFDTPIVGQGDRWSGRERRRFEVSETYASDVRKAEKEAFLRHFEESKCRWRAKIAGQKGEDLGQARKSEQVWEDSADGACTTVYWTVWGKEQWEKAQGRKASLALFLQTAGSSAPNVAFPVEPNPSVIALASLLDSQNCRFSVYTRDRPNPHVDMIPYNRIVKAISEIGSASQLFAFDPPSHLRSLTPTASPRSRSRSRSFLDTLASPLAVFGSNSPKRSPSIRSRTSSSSHDQSMNGSTYGTTSNKMLSPANSSMARKLVRKVSGRSMRTYEGSVGARSVVSLREGGEEANWFASPSLSPRKQVIVELEQQQVEVDEDAQEEEEEVEEMETEMEETEAQVQEEEESGWDILDEINRELRSSEAYAGVGSEREEEEDEAMEEEQDLDVGMDAPFSDGDRPRDSFSPRRHASLPPAPRDESPSPTLNPFRSSYTQPRMGSPYHRDMDMRPTPDIGTSPIAARPTTGRRGMIGPRDPTPTRPRSAMSTYQPMETSELIVPINFYASPPTQPLRPTPSSSASSALAVASRSESSTTITAGSDKKRTLSAASPRPSPSKKVAASTPVISPLVVRKKMMGAQDRVPSSGSLADRRKQRTVSGASTLRESSPPLVVAKSVVEDVYDFGLTSELAPNDSLQAHVSHLRSILAREISHKENVRAVSPTISRSPVARDLHRQASMHSIRRNPTTSTDTSAPSSIELGTLLRWTEQLTELVDRLSKADDVDLASERDAWMEERETMRAQLVAVGAAKDELSNLYAAELVEQRNLCYEFQQGLDEAFAITNSNPGDRLDRLSTALKAAMVEKARLASDNAVLRDANARLQHLHEEDARLRLEGTARDEEKDEWGRMLREMGLIP